MTLVIFASKGGEAGIVSILGSVAPDFILPGLRVISACRPVLGGWVGVSIVFFGTALIFITG
ncbi:MAG: hypothetical protein VX915_01855 [Pseudomonadota bacterium]|nr:hypothetical protein [Pseudomonadota bacterium]